LVFLQTLDILQPGMLQHLLGRYAGFSWGENLEDEVFGFFGDIGPVIVS
jgi:hypothetical protein